jgi:hypothetical protein
VAVNKGAATGVKGLAELRRELRKLDEAESPQWSRALRDANIEVAQLVVDKAKPRMAALSAMGVKAASTLRASRSEVAARLMLGSHAVPYAQGVEFGADRNVPRQLRNRTIVGWRQFQPWRGSGRGAGYALYPTIRDNEPKIVDTYGDMIDQIMRDAFPD